MPVIDDPAFRAATVAPIDFGREGAESLGQRGVGEARRYRLEKGNANFWRCPSRSLRQTESSCQRTIAILGPTGYRLFQSVHPFSVDPASLKDGIPTFRILQILA
jgi:hypothetical protein